MPPKTNGNLATLRNFDVIENKDAGFEITDPKLIVLLVSDIQYIFGND